MTVYRATKVSKVVNNRQLLPVNVNGRFHIDCAWCWLKHINCLIQIVRPKAFHDLDNLSMKHCISAAVCETRLHSSV